MLPDLRVIAAVFSGTGDQDVYLAAAHGGRWHVVKHVDPGSQHGG